jgi:ABC-2 type transport system ATP-binding protein
MSVLQVDIIKAGYVGKKQVIEDINFSVKQSEIVGLIGPNGAGKSTTIKAIVGLIPEVTGRIQFIGHKKNYAYIPEQPILYEDLTLWEHLELAAAVNEIERAILLEKGNELLSIFRLQEVKHHFPASFSKGMQQKVMIILGLLMQPDVYVIDEPFVGLDPRATMEFIRFLKDERKRGAGILLSTHQLDIAEKICDSIMLIIDGKLVVQGSITEIQEQCKLPGASLFDCFDSILENEYYVTK